jgi:hypothetical protein
MAVTTFEDFYNLVKNNIVYFQYRKNDVILNIKGTLDRNFIPGSPDDLERYDAAITFSDYSLGRWSGTDSAEKDIIFHIEKKVSIYRPPEWLKVYSTNYEKWINIRIRDIVSLRVVES